MECFSDTLDTSILQLELYFSVECFNDKSKSQLKSRLDANLASRDPVRKPASLCKEVEAGKLASTGASSTLFGIF